MHRSRIVTLALAAALSLSLAGCLGLGEKDGGPDDPAGAVLGLAEDATEVARTLGGIDWGKTVRAVVRDAATGEELAEVADQARIEGLFSPLSQVSGMAPAPDAPEEYVVEVWEPETVRLGQSADDVGEYKGLEVVTYEGSDVVTLRVVPISLSVNLASEGGVADAVRELAR
ncbi:hypothetical protein [Olsenella sp. An290]|uniref:hypothetical protein n=1 Tax=Olsenella sp. An290 TaxID=1965625 RepID=UPI000B397863|nr:hypothetical protein [Olsenella sp. An290]OUO35962.1 hypothetical protein B5F84_01230 [Olsenella sp. An290]